MQEKTLSKNLKYADDWEGLKNIYWLKLPHHGSKRNISCAMINHFRTFGIGLSWGGVALSLAEIYNGGISLYQDNGHKLSKGELIDRMLSSFQKGT